MEFLKEILSIDTTSAFGRMQQLMFEAKKTDTATKLNTGAEVDLNDIFRERPHHNITSANKPKNVKLTQAGRERTAQAVSGIQMDPKSAELLNQLHQSGLEDDREVRPRHRAGVRTPVGNEPETPRQELAVRGQDLATRGQDLATQSGEPQWHKIEDLPGYMASAIRAIGRQVFAPLTTTDIEDIDVIANLGGSGQPNSDKEIGMVGNYLKKHGQRQTEAEIDFNRSVLRGYKADVQIWRAGDKEFLTVKDHAGKYIYSWPVEDSQSFDISRPRLK